MLCDYVSLLHAVESIQISVMQGWGNVHVLLCADVHV